jgi:23S rRNA pseudouridine2457 synthase
MIVLFNKPYGVISQFSNHEIHKTLKNFIDIPNIYPAGRLDTDSEGLLILTDDGRLQHQISSPTSNKYKGYWVQVEGEITQSAINLLSEGMFIKDYKTLPAIVSIIQEPNVWQREKPIRYRKNIPTSWINIQITEGKNRQIRKMTAKAGHPSLRLIRYKVDRFYIDNIKQGQFQVIK